MNWVRILQFNLFVETIFLMISWVKLKNLDDQLQIIIQQKKFLNSFKFKLQELKKYKAFNLELINSTPKLN